MGSPDGGRLEAKNEEPFRKQFEVQIVNRNFSILRQRRRSYRGFAEEHHKKIDFIFESQRKRLKSSTEEATVKETLLKALCRRLPTNFPGGILLEMYQKARFYRGGFLMETVRSAEATHTTRCSAEATV